MEPERSRDLGDKLLSDLSDDYFEQVSTCSEADEDSQA
jgi:hypothetical protein